MSRQTKLTIILSFLGLAIVLACICIPLAMNPTPPWQVQAKTLQQTLVRDQQVHAHKVRENKRLYTIQQRAKVDALRQKQTQARARHEAAAHALAAARKLAVQDAQRVISQVRLSMESVLASAAEAVPLAKRTYVVNRKLAVEDAQRVVSQAAEATKRALNSAAAAVPLAERTHKKIREEFQSAQAAAQRAAERNAKTQQDAEDKEAAEARRSTFIATYVPELKQRINSANTVLALMEDFVRTAPSASKRSGIFMRQARASPTDEATLGKAYSLGVVALYHPDKVPSSATDEDKWRAAEIFKTLGDADVKEKLLSGRPAFAAEPSPAGGSGGSSNAEDEAWTKLRRTGYDMDYNHSRADFHRVYMGQNNPQSALDAWELVRETDYHNDYNDDHRSFMQAVQNLDNPLDVCLTWNLIKLRGYNRHYKNTRGHGDNHADFIRVAAQLRDPLGDIQRWFDMDRWDRQDYSNNMKTFLQNQLPRGQPRYPGEGGGNRSNGDEGCRTQ